MLRLFLPIVDEIKKSHSIDFPIRIGGGSMLLRRYKHRKSKDLDLFVSDAKLVRLCSPGKNEAAEELFPDYTEDSISIKFISGMQEIDVIVTNDIFEDNAVDEVILFDRPVLIERPREIIAKKLIYRGRKFQPRDIFDLACVAFKEPNEISAIQPYLNLTHIGDLEARLEEIEPLMVTQLDRMVEEYREFSDIKRDCFAIAKDVVNTFKVNLTPKVELPKFPDGYRASYSKDGSCVVIKQPDPNTGKHEIVSNTLGPAIIGPEGSRYFIDGVELSEDDWSNHPSVTLNTSSLKI